MHAWPDCRWTTETSPGHRPPTVLVGARLQGQNHHSFAPGHLQQCPTEPPASPTSTDDSDANQAWDDYAGDIAPAPEDSEPESGLSSQYEDSEDEQDDVLDIHAEEGPVAPDLKVPEEHEPAVPEDPQGPTPSWTPARTTPQSTPKRGQAESPRTPIHTGRPPLELSPLSIHPLRGFGPIPGDPIAGGIPKAGMKV
ncbi:hypothetical protein M5D96_012320 [Drosophila gunungcola]|uniref:Uncharacterized protein n=1 Tax=Drosophila gunungcola TaxID=103775 RepID=A0A9P9YDA3_9MUSC|nr:hypothetical protein M5D96_012320 [Drosophila gunungcola]